MLEQVLATMSAAGEEDHAWRDAAACLDEDPELFFPEGESERYRPQIEAALEVCGTCEVAEACLTYALETEQRTGIWGGTTATARRRLEVVDGRVQAVRRGRTGGAAAAALAAPPGLVLDDDPDAGLRRAAG